MKCLYHLLILLLMPVSIINAQNNESESTAVYQVGTKDSPPFAYQNVDGEWDGLGIELWKRIALELNFGFEIQEQELDDLLKNIENGQLDVVAGSITVTPEREKVMDFTHPFYSSGLGIAVSEKGGWSLFQVISRIFSTEFISVLFFLAAMLFGAGWLVWFFEHKHNSEQFGGKNYEGVMSGFWWSAVTMTTVGYGDKAPMTLGGRIVALIWMFTGIIVISGITASITSALTVTQLESAINDPNDLTKVRVGTVSSSTSYEYLRQRGIRTNVFDDIQTVLQALDDGRVEAVVYDKPILQYQIATNTDYRIQVLPFTLQRQDYGLALTSNNPNREEINIALLNIITSESWKDYLEQQLGAM